MVALIKTFAFSGIDASKIDVQVKISSAVNPFFNIVGLGDKAVAESKERVRAAISSTGLEWPSKRIIVNLAPADIQKEGSHYDLAIALGIMIEMGVLESRAVDDYFVLGELALDGAISKVNGIISAAIGANQKNCGIICPKVNGSEAAWAGDLNIIAAADLLTLINHLKGQQLLARPQVKQLKISQNYPDFSEIKGQESAKRALEIAATGGHNLLMIGAPGAGKSMLASRLPSILPDLELMEILEINMINSVSGKINDGNLITQRPFREVHHSCSMPAMVGGGSFVKAGEISLAHNGILFLDELAEFPRQVLDSLRQPLENGTITISRVNSRISFPANFQLIAAMNPCPCGYLGSNSKECKKAPICGQDYKNKISGPLLDRIDMVIEVPVIDYFDHYNKKRGESSEIIKNRVLAGRKLQINRFSYLDQEKNITNANMDSEMVEKYCQLSDDCQNLLKIAIEKIGLSMRGISKILKVSRTIADLESSDNIGKNHLLEAISYRRQL